jgi:hypothetical protein
MRFDVSTAEKMPVFAQLSPEDGGSYVPPKHWYLPTNPHGCATKKTNIGSFYVVRGVPIILTVGFLVVLRHFRQM